jgi:hypothetical protein
MSDHAPLTSAEQSGLMTALQRSEYHESDLPSDVLGAGLWFVYAALVLFWFRRSAERQVLSGLLVARERIVVPIVAQYKARSLERAKEIEHPRPQIFTEPIAQI